MVYDDHYCDNDQNNNDDDQNDNDDDQNNNDDDQNNNDDDYQCFEDQELLLGYTQPLKALDYQHTLKITKLPNYQIVTKWQILRMVKGQQWMMAILGNIGNIGKSTLSKNCSRPQREQSA